MVAAVIFAGGVGARMKSEEIPKQFLMVDGKPIIIRTLESFSKNPEVDKIVIACLDNWIDRLKELLVEFEIKKVDAIVPGGKNGFESIHNGLMEAAKDAFPNDLALICDGVRPLVSNQLVSNCIMETRVYGSAIPVTPSIDSVLESQDGTYCQKNYLRSEMYITQAPQGFTFEKILWAHDEAEKRNITNPTSSAELLIELGEKVHIFRGERDNIKVTTPEDLHTLRARYYYEHYRRFAREEALYEL